LAGQLTSKGIVSRAYHAGLKPEQRTEVQQKWMDEEIPVIVATVSFGMGVDKANVRLVTSYAVQQPEIVVSVSLMCLQQCNMHWLCCTTLFKSLPRSSVLCIMSSVHSLLPSSLLGLLLTGRYPNPWRPITRSQVELVGMGSQLSVDCTTPGEGIHTEYVLMCCFVGMMSGYFFFCVSAL